MRLVILLNYKIKIFHIIYSAYKSLFQYYGYYLSNLLFKLVHLNDVNMTYK